MINLILFGSFFVMLLLNIPIAVSLGMSSIFALLFSSSPLTVVPTNVYSGMAKFLLLAIPFFVLSGNIMAKAGISSRLVAFADDCVGHRRGGIAIVAVIVACFFGAISGSGPATVAALGIILIPAMINRGGFSAPFASSLMASASSIAIVIPPSIAFVVYASITGVSVGDMFMGGWIPGIMMGLSLVIIIMIECRKKGIQASKAKSSWGQRWKSFREAFWGFLMPVIIIGGIYGGVFTPTEAAAVSVVYGLVVGVFIYREVKMKDMIDILVDSGKTTGGIMLIIGAATPVLLCVHGVRHCAGGPGSAAGDLRQQVHLPADRQRDLPDCRLLRGRQLRHVHFYPHHVPRSHPAGHRPRPLRRDRHSEPGYRPGDSSRGCQPVRRHRCVREASGPAGQDQGHHCLYVQGCVAPDCGVHYCAAAHHLCALVLYRALVRQISIS